MAFSKAWFEEQAKKKKQEELDKKLAENPDYKEPIEEKQIEVSRSIGIL